MKVLLCALSAKYVHKTLAPWCLKSYCDTVGTWDIQILEASVNDELGRIAREIYLLEPDVLGLSCYIWNLDQTRRLSAMVKKLLPGCVLVYGGPEASFGGDFPEADYVIPGPGEQSLARLLALLQAGTPPAEKNLPPAADLFPNLPSPYTEAYFASFGEGGIASRLVYYESIRGCPFSCAYCLSSAVDGVHSKPLEVVFEELTLLLEHGATTVKFVDRTFNANRPRAKKVLAWIAGLDTGCTFHFEAAADLFDQELLALLAVMPKGRVQLELGIQSVHEPTLAAIGRQTDTALCLDTISRLTRPGNCHIHVDLIAGLPLETMETFAEGVNACIKAAPHMLQLGFLKLLRGTALRRQSDTLGLLCHDDPPYEVVRTPTLSTRELLRLKEVEEVLDKFYNSGKYAASLAYALDLFPTPFACFSALADFCAGSSLRISLKRTYTLLLDFLTHWGNREMAERCIRLDCLTYDFKGQLPDGMPALQDKELERSYRQRGRRQIRVERFGEREVLLFDYSQIDPITGACQIEVLS